MRARQEYEVGSPWTRRLVWGIALFMFAIISGRTLWIDEFSTATLARESSPLSALRYARSNLGSEALMPAWVVLTNLIANLFGTSELGLRVPNALWLAMAVLVMSQIGIRRTNIGPALAFALLPFVWYYGHEARPYALQLLLGAVWAWAAWKVTSSGWRAGTWLLVAATTAMVWTGLTTAIIGLAMSVSVVVLGRRDLHPNRQMLRLALASVLLIGPVMAYYAFAVIVEGTSAARLWQVGISNIAFSAYEVFGFVGLGPGRLDLRDAGLLGIPTVIELLRAHLWWLILLAVAWLATIGLLASQLPAIGSGMPPAARRFLVVGTISAIAGMLALFAAALVAAFPVWGRHFAPLVPTLAAILGMAAQHVWVGANGRSPLPTAIMALLGTVLLVSSLQLRFLDRHQVEDYKRAVGIVHSAIDEGFSVAWFATMPAIEYYLARDQRRDQIFRPTSYPIDADGPMLIALSKPDIHDPQAIAAETMSGAGSTLECAFAIRGFTFGVLGAENSALCRRNVEELGLIERDDVSHLDTRAD